MTDGHATTTSAARCDHPEHLHGCPGDCWTRPHDPCPSGCTKVWHASSNRVWDCPHGHGPMEPPQGEERWHVCTTCGEHRDPEGQPRYVETSGRAIPNRVPCANCEQQTAHGLHYRCDCDCHATPNRAADYPEDLRWRQHVEDEIVCLQEAVADLQRRMAT